MTKIIRRKSDNVVIFHGDDLSLNDSGAHAENWRSKAVTTSDYSILDVVSVPEPFYGGWYTFDGISWTLTEIGTSGMSEIQRSSVPAEVTIRQAELALREAGYLAAVETWVTTLDGELEIYWKRSQTVRRDHAFVEAARVELGLTHQQMDQLFILAATKEP